MAEKFQRSVAVTINTTRYTALDVKFEIEKSLKAEPNKCTLEIWNLNEDHRAEIEQLNPPTRAGSALEKKKQKQHRATHGIPVKIEAGYGEDLSLLWLGDLRTGKSEYSGTDWLTTLTSGDGEKAWQNARANISYGPKTPVDTVLRAIVREMKIGEGNLDAVIRSLSVNGIGKLKPRGTVIYGPLRDVITDWARSADLEVSIQDGSLQFINRGKALDGEAIRLSATTGMLESPSVDIDGILHAKMLFHPDVRPGRLLVVDAERVKGNYRIEKAKYIGDTAGTEWTIEMQGNRY